MVINKVIFIFFIFLSTTSCALADSRITMKNIENFKSTFNSELPVGSSRADVESYLAKLNLEYSYVESERKFYAIIPKIGRYRIIYESSLLIRVQMDVADKVEKIEYKIEHTGL